MPNPTHKADNQRWRSAIYWARSKGIRTNYTAKYGALRAQIIKAGLVDEWNARYPEYAISEAV